MNADEIDRELFKLDNRGRGYTRDADAIISLIFRCDMMTAQQIINRIGEELKIGSHPVIVLKTADPMTISRHTLEVLQRVRGQSPDL